MSKQVCVKFLKHAIGRKEMYRLIVRPIVSSYVCPNGVLVWGSPRLKGMTEVREIRVQLER